MAQSLTHESGIHRFVFTGTWGVDAVCRCWCGKSHRLSTLGWRVMFRNLNAWLQEHEQCEPLAEQKAVKSA